MPSGHFTTDHPSVCAQVTGSESDPENIETGTQALQSTVTSLTLVSGPGERNYPCLEGLTLVANLWTKMGRGGGVNPSTLPLAASPAQRRSSVTKQIVPEFLLAPGFGC